MTEAAAKIGFISLGCPKATWDSERILTQLRADGYDLSADYESADLVVVNTCGFIEDAVEESIEAINEACVENDKVIVTGCLGARRQIIEDRCPDLLAITGPQAFEEVVRTVHKHLPRKHNPFTSLTPAIAPGGLKLTPRHYAYLKISEGCNHRCRFCVIPSMRGDLVSRSVSEIMLEAESLVSAGVKELLVISQDTSAYGVDVKYRTEFYNGRPIKSNMRSLAAALGSLGVWIRLHYVYPYPHVDEVVELMRDEVILPYLDVPFQHASSKILKLMKRPASSQKNLDRINAWRDTCSDLAIRSTFIVGFPGETERDFEELLEFLQQAKLDRVGCFIYSPVEGAVANELSNQVDDDVKQERLERFMTLQQDISAEKLKSKIGRKLSVLVDARQDDKTLIARSYADAPEIDGVVYLDAENTNIKIGEFVNVKVTGSTEHDLYAEIM